MRRQPRRLAQLRLSLPAADATQSQHDAAQQRQLRRPAQLRLSLPAADATQSQLSSVNNAGQQSST
jgi:hypothetical protein